ncbi:hypothetical protein [Scytonema sp. PCC 10023]|uniref:hypothetical protein n=1 Tax=Scytonema sp. PCC 10023 TaxID=1680591 RepID=UPI0039C5B421
MNLQQLLDFMTRLAKRNSDICLLAFLGFLAFLAVISLTRPVNPTLQAPAVNGHDSKPEKIQINNDNTLLNKGGTTTGGSINHDKTDDSQIKDNPVCEPPYINDHLESGS